MRNNTQNAVARAVWAWDTPKADVDVRARLRFKALIQSLVMSAVAALFYFWRGHVVLPAALAALAAVNLALGLAAPRAFGAVDRAMQAFGHGVGTAVTWIVLVPFFYLFMLPGRLILLAMGKDPLDRRFPDTPTSYWVPRRPAKSMDDYRKQFG